MMKWIPFNLVVITIKCIFYIKHVFYCQSGNAAREQLRVRNTKTRLSNGYDLSTKTTKKG